MLYLVCSSSLQVMQRDVEVLLLSRSSAIRLQASSTRIYIHTYQLLCRIPQTDIFILVLFYMLQMDSTKKLVFIKNWKFMYICLFFCLLYPVSLVCAKLSSADRNVYVLVRCTNKKESNSHTQCNEARRILDLWQLLPSYGESFYLAAVVCCSLCVMTALFIPASTKQGFPKDKFGPSNARPVCGCSVHKTLLF